MPIKTMPLGVTAVMLPDLDFDEQIALCSKLGVTHYGVRPRVIPDEQKGKPWGCWGNHKFDLTPARLVKEADQIAKKLSDAGMLAFSTVPSASVMDDDDTLKMHFEGAAKVGAGRVRVAPLPVPAEMFDYKALLAEIVEKFGRVVEIARPFKQKVVIETHCRSIATSPALALNICQNFAADEIGVIFDLANFNIEGFVQPHVAVSVLGDYIDHCHIGGSRTLVGSTDKFGFRESGHMMCAVTEANLHMPSWIEALHKAGRDVPMLIEDFTPNRPGVDRLTDSAVALQRVLDGLG